MGIFRFRHFSVENTDSAMKVNTDGVLLGALMTVRMSDRKCLDVGTGTGTVALMAAQRLSFLHDLHDPHDPHGDSRTRSVSVSDSPGSEASEMMVYAIDIDGPSAAEASRNFSASPWPGMLCAVHASLEEFVPMPQCREFDHIFSNPPYYDMSLAAPEQRRNTARHTDSLSYRELVEFSSRHLSADGVLSVILPADSELWLLRHARMHGLYPYRIVRVRTTVRKRPSRIMAEFSLSRPDGDMAEELLTIHDGNGYSDDYLALTGDFYINF